MWEAEGAAGMSSYARCLRVRRAGLDDQLDHYTPFLHMRPHAVRRKCSRYSFVAWKEPIQMAFSLKQQPDEAWPWY